MGLFTDSGVNIELVSRLGETQQFFKCKNSAILCKVNAKVCKKVQEKSVYVQFGFLNFRLYCHPEFISGPNQNVVNTPN